MKQSKDKNGSIYTLDLMTLKQTAEFLNLHYITVIRKVKSGEIPSINVFGKIRVSKAKLMKILGI